MDESESVTLPPRVPAAAVRSSPGWAAHTHVGRRRQNNEDAWGVCALGPELVPLTEPSGDWPEHGLLLMVSDGMGGALAGEVASQMCVERLAVELHARRANPDRRTAMTLALHEVHVTLAVEGASSRDRTGMGATLSALWLLPDGTAVVGHVGDSRIYRWRDGQARVLTEDHSVGAGMVRRGEIDPAAVMRLRFHALLEQVMGGDGAAIRPQVDLLEWRPGDQWLLCSDGLHGPLGGEFGGVCAEAWLRPHLEETVADLVGVANAAGGPDNITAVVVRCRA